MNKKNLLKKFRYDPETGELYWKEKGPNKNTTSPVGTHVNNGYRQVLVDGKLEYVHVVIWVMHNTQFDRGKCSITHINRDVADNRIENLALIDRATVRHRTRQIAEKMNVTGYRGVTRKVSKNYRATIMDQGTFIGIGMYETAEEAARAYDKKAIELFGDFAELNFPDEHK